MSTFVRLSRTVLALAVFCHAAALFAQEKPREQDHPYQRDQWFMRGRTVNGKPGAAELHQAWGQKMNARAARARVSAVRGASTEGAQNQVNSAGALSITNTATPNGAVWTPLGPAPALTAAPCPAQFCQSQDYGPVVGRITTVVVDPSDPSGNTVYIGGATGGLWKSTNAADSNRTCSSTGSCVAQSVTWTPLIDSQPSLTVGAMALQPGNSSLMIVGTGEANSSADSYYGQGFLRSINGGLNWTSISSATVSGVSTDLTGIGFLKIAFSSDNNNLAVAAGASSSMGPQTGAQQSSDNRLGLYYSLDSGATWTRATVTDGTAGTPDPGSATDIVYVPKSVNGTGTFFAALRFHGIYSSSDGINWTKLPNQPPPAVSNCTPTINRSCSFYRAALTLVPGRNEMYAFVVDLNDNDQGIYQTLDGGTTWTQVPTAATLDNCTNTATNDGSGNGCGTDQGSYNLTIVAIPNGTTNTDLYAGAVNEYKCTLTGTGPAASSCSFINLTRVYGCQDTSGVVRTGANVHPDEHAIAFVSDATHPIYFGNDGGIYRVLNPQNLADNCPGLSNNRVGATLFDNLDANMGAMLQFVSFSQHPSDDTILFGGTQDNGTPKKDSTAPLNVSGYGYSWGTAHIADGGYTEINVANGDWFASYPVPFAVQRCTKGSACIDADFPYTLEIDDTSVSNDAHTFYPVYVLDPASESSSSTATQTQLVLGTCRIWRGSSDGTTATAGNPGWSPGSPISNNFDANSNTTCSGSEVNMISALAVGGPTAAATSTHPVVSKVIYAGTEGLPASASGGSGSGGLLFVTFNADTAAAGGVGPGTGWTNITAPGAAACTATPTACNINPGHYNISGIALDPSDATGHTAYVTVMGFHVAHVLKTTDGGATWAALDGDSNNGGLPDAPADSVVVHPNIPGQIYVGTDVGVFVYNPVQKAWTEEGPVSGSGFLPNVAVTKVAIFNSGGTYKLRASTYGRGIWETAIPATGAPDFSLDITNPEITLYPGQTATFSGKLTYFNGYNSQVTISCQGAQQPASCNPGTQPLAAGAPSFSVTASDVAGEYDFNIQAVGSDSNTTTHSIAVKLHVVDFTLSAPNPNTITAKNGTTATTTVTLAPVAGTVFSTTVNLTCAVTGNLNVSCNPASPVVSAPTNVQLTINAGPNAIPSPPTYTLTITATTADGQRSKNTTLSLTIVTNTTVILACSSCTGSPATTIPLIKATQQGSATVTVSGQDNYNGDFNSMKCQVAPLSGPGPVCSLSAASVSPVLLNPASTPVTLTLQGPFGSTGTVTVSGTASGSVTDNPLPLVLAYDIGDFTVAAAQAVSAVPGGSANLQFPVASVAKYAGTLNVSCATSDPNVACTALTPVTLAANGAATVTAVLSPAANVTVTDKTINVTVTDSTLNSLVRTSSGVLHVQDFQVAASPASNTVKAGSPSQHTLTLTSLNGLSGAVSLSVSGCPATALMTCTLSSTSPTLTSAAPATVTLSISTTAATAMLGAPPLPRRGSPLFAFWLGLPAIALGFVGAASAGTGRERVGTSALACPAARQRRGRWTLLAISALALLMVLAACGGGGSGSTTKPPTPQPGTPAGPYTITVTATAGSGANSVTHIQTINLTVQ